MRKRTVRFNARKWAATRSRAQISDRPTLELNREDGLDGIAKRGDVVVDERRVLVHHMRSHKRHERQVPVRKFVRQYRAPPTEPSEGATNALMPHCAIDAPVPSLTLLDGSRRSFVKGVGVVLEDEASEGGRGEVSRRESGANAREPMDDDLEWFVDVVEGLRWIVSVGLRT